MDNKLLYLKANISSYAQLNFRFSGLFKTINNFEKDNKHLKDFWYSMTKLLQALAQKSINYNSNILYFLASIIINNKVCMK